MVKAQIHDEFKSFVGKTVDEAAKLMADFVESNSLAVKSLSVLDLKNRVVLTIGFRTDETPYTVNVEVVKLGDPNIPVPLNADAIDAKIEDAENSITGDVICHSLFQGVMDGLLYVAFLLHG